MSLVVQRVWGNVRTHGRSIEGGIRAVGVRVTVDGHVDRERAKQVAIV
jgi:hypothetical protein